MAPSSTASTARRASSQDTRKERGRVSLFRHTNQTFISKPPEPAASPSKSIFGANTSTSSFTFSSGDSAPAEPPIKKRRSITGIPTFTFANPRQPSDTVEDGTSDSDSRSRSMDSLAHSMASLKMPSSAASLSSASKSTTPSAEEAPSEESSPLTTSESELSSDEDSVLNRHLDLLQRRPGLDELNEIRTTPLFTEAVRRYAVSLAGTASEKPFSQYGLLAGHVTDGTDDGADPRIFWNIAAPSSFFICGSQGSGKSHTLSCLLENALAPCKANVLPRPLTGIVFHYDTFISDSGGSPCEVAWLSSNPDIKVRVLCPPTNVGTMRVSRHNPSPYPTAAS